MRGESTAALGGSVSSLQRGKRGMVGRCCVHMEEKKEGGGGSSDRHQPEPDGGGRRSTEAGDARGGSGEGRGFMGHGGGWLLV
jgi:hypothetical protein